MGKSALIAGAYTMPGTILPMVIINSKLAVERIEMYYVRKNV